VSDATRDHRPQRSVPWSAARRIVALLPIVARADARRAASWIVMAAAAAAAWALGGGEPAAVVPAAIACGGLAAVAALGPLPAADRGTSDATWLARIGWVMAGGGAGAVAGALAGPSAAAAWGAGVLLVAAALTGAVVRGAVARGAAAADAASLGLSIAAAAAAAATLPVPASRAAAIGFACWLLFATAAALTAGHWRSVEPAAPGGPGRTEAAGLGRGPAGVWLTWLAMASTLGAMVACYFLAAEHAWRYAAFAAGWFVALAVPAATIAAGPRDAGERAGLVRSAPGRARLPGTLGHALGTVAWVAAILGWPAVVAAVLWGADAASPGGPLAAVALLAALVALVAAAIWAAFAWRLSGETALALLATAVMAAIIAALPASPDSPNLRSVSPALGATAS
jgi:hypothetical protein